MQVSAKGAIRFVLFRALSFTLAMSAYNLGWDGLFEHKPIVLGSSHLIMTVAGCSAFGIAAALVDWFWRESFLRSDRGKSTQSIDARTI